MLFTLYLPSALHEEKTAVNFEEGLVDFYTQILVNGMKADMVDPIPETLKVGNDIWKLQVHPSEAAKIRKQYLKEQEILLRQVMNKVVGKYVFI